MTIPSSMGSDPPHRLVPLPRATKGDLVPMAQIDRLDDLALSLGEHHRRRTAAKGRESIRLVRHEVAGFRQKPVGWVQPTQCLDKG